MDAIMCVISMGWKDFLLKGFTWRTTNSFTAFFMLVGPFFQKNSFFLILGMTRAFDFKQISLVLEKCYVLKNFFEILLASVKMIVKVTLLLGYVLFIFGTFGMQFFSLTKWNYGLDSNTNYHTFPSAFTSFIKFAAGEDWYDTFLACSIGPPKCYQRSSGNNNGMIGGGGGSDCGSAFFSTLIYHMFYILVMLILQHLYVATMVDTYVSTFALSNDQTTKDASLLGFKQENIKQFQQIWSSFDIQALGYLHRKQLLDFLTLLEPPLGLGSHQEMKRALGPNGAHDHKILCQAYRKRMEMYEEIDARIAEQAYRLRLTQDDFSGGDLSLPSTVVRFTDLLMVLTERIVPLECLSVQNKVDELAVRGYVRKYRLAIKIQKTFRMYRAKRKFIKRRRIWRKEQQEQRLLLLKHEQQHQHQHHLLQHQQEDITIIQERTGSGQRDMGTNTTIKEKALGSSSTYSPASASLIATAMTSRQTQPKHEAYYNPFDFDFDTTSSSSQTCPRPSTSTTTTSTSLIDEFVNKLDL
jgi:hypothetical protein